jgi:hypothetical protein
MTLFCFVSMTATPSALRSRSSFAHSSSGTLGGHFGSPLSATYNLEPSRVSLSPRGRLPTAIVAMTSPRSVSNTETVWPSSFET